MPHPCHNAYTSILARDVNAHARSTRRTWTLDDDDVYYYIRWRLKLEGETENTGVCTKERKGGMYAAAYHTAHTHLLGAGGKCSALGECGCQRRALGLRGWSQGVVTRCRVSGRVL